MLVPADTVTEVGTVAVTRLLSSDTTSPPDGATVFRLMVAVDEVPPDTVEGFTVRLVNDGGFTVRFALT